MRHVFELRDLSFLLISLKIVITSIVWDRACTYFAIARWFVVIVLVIDSDSCSLDDFSFSFFFFFFFLFSGCFSSHALTRRAYHFPRFILVTDAGSFERNWLRSVDFDSWWDGKSYSQSTHLDIELNEWLMNAWFRTSHLRYLRSILFFELRCYE
jgi:hypothetical protein